MLLWKTTQGYLQDNDSDAIYVKDLRVRLGTTFLLTTVIGAGLCVGYSVAGAIVGFVTFKMMLGF